MNLRPPRAAFRALRGFVTIPGFISLMGLVLALVVHYLERTLEWEDPSWLPYWLDVPVDAAQAALSVIATGAMSALVMVYSIVLLVYTMAASSIGPRLLQRFREDVINQIAVGVLGATFLYSLLGIWLIREQYQIHMTAAVGLTLAVLSVLFLLYFVKEVSARVTIDQEAAQIARSLSDQMESALEMGAQIPPSDLVLPSGPECEVNSERSGYIDTITGTDLVDDVASHGAFVVYRVRPGDFVMAGEPIASVIGPESEDLRDRVRDAAPLTSARNPVGDLRFSVNLLVEIALRALSPGVNDTFTAINCLDHLSATISRARQKGLSLGTFCDEDGAARVVSPEVGAQVLFEEAFPPLRRAARGNGLMTDALARALGRMGRAAPGDGRQPHIDQLLMLRDNLEGSSLPPDDRAWADRAICSELATLGVEIEPRAHGREQNPEETGTSGGS